jgi:predicted nucleotidyltransferase
MGRASREAMADQTDRRSCHHGHVATPADGLARLRAAAASGELDALCARHGVRVLTVFGSAARGEPAARDLDVAVLSEPGAPFDPVALVADLVDLTGVQEVDLAHLNRAGPVLRERALVGVVPLFENAPGRFAAAQTAAIGERIETDEMRRLDLKLLATRRGAQR